VLFANLHSHTISKFGRKNSVLVGLLILSLSNFGLGLLEYIPITHPNVFISLNVVLRFVQGYADSLTFSTCYSLIMITFEKNK